MYKKDIKKRKDKLKGKIGYLFLFIFFLVYLCNY